MILAVWYSPQWGVTLTGPGGFTQFAANRERAEAIAKVLGVEVQDAD